MQVEVKFLGASRTVTGSKYLIKSDELEGDILVDAGLFQGSREWKEQNWESLPFDVTKIKAVLITHSHIDHIGFLPRLVKLGLNCPVFLTHASKDLAELMLIDSAQLQEEEARYRSEHRISRHANPVPLYNVADAKAAIKLLIGVQFNIKAPIIKNVSATWSRAGHILGAASISVEINNNQEKKSIQFSGDIGRFDVPILPDPEGIEFGDLLLIESTYGNRLHDDNNPKEALKKSINETITRDGVILIPSFAVGRTQELLFYIRELKEADLIPDVPVIVDSPMAQDATKIYYDHLDSLDNPALKAFSKGHDIFRPNKLYFVRDRKESIELNNIKEPMILISASGMLAGGRILHHIRHRIADSKNTLLFVGYQPEGGKGAWIKSGASTVRIFNEEIPIRAQISEISSLSAHGDYPELIRWCKSGTGLPKKVAVVHGENNQAESFAKKLKEELNWDCFVPSYLETYKV
jgi:metallo-beta-lactamase family protein